MGNQSLFAVVLMKITPFPGLKSAFYLGQATLIAIFESVVTRAHCSIGVHVKFDQTTFPPHTLQCLPDCPHT